MPCLTHLSHGLHRHNIDKINVGKKELRKAPSPIEPEAQSTGLDTSLSMPSTPKMRNKEISLIYLYIYI